MEFVSKLNVCQKIKYPYTMSARLLQVASPPSQVCEDIAMDFIVGLQSFSGSTVIMVVIRHFSKAGHFWDVTTRFRAHKVVEFSSTISANYMDIMYRREIKV